MAITGEALVEIDLVDFYKFLNPYVTNNSGLEISYGVPRINNSNGTLEVDILFSDDGDPADWMAYEDTKVYKQWQELKTSNLNK